jgi:hypothetical protein
MNKTNIIGAIAVIAFILGVIGLSNSGAPAPASMPAGAVSNTNAPAAGTVAPNGSVLPNPSVLDYLVNRVMLYTDKTLAYGNSSGTPLYKQAARMTLATATTTPCALQSPFTSTSTLVSFALNVTTGTSTTGSLTLATSTTAYATTSAITTFNIASGAKATPVWTGGNDVGVVAPSGYVVVGVKGANFGFTYVGTCSAIFQTL